MVTLQALLAAKAAQYTEEAQAAKGLAERSARRGSTAAEVARLYAIHETLERAARDFEAIAQTA